MLKKIRSMLAVADHRFASRMDVDSFAGTGLAGYEDGPGGVARFNLSQGLAVDAVGNVYVADTCNNRIRKISVNGVVSTLAGDGSNGCRNGIGTTSRFDYPTGIALDWNGNLFVADQDNHLIRRISPDGWVSTVAGDGQPGYQDGDCATAKFNYPSGLAVDAAGNIYVADQGNHCIRVVRQSGAVSTLAGNGSGSYRDGAGANAEFNFPSSVAVDLAGRVFVADSCNNLVRRITPFGTVTTLAGDGCGAFRDGKCVGAQFNHPYGIAVDLAGNVLVADTYNNRIRKISPAGCVITLAGAGERACNNGSGTRAAFNYPTGLAPAVTGNIFVADAGNSLIRVLR
jgi:hypothetical protein